MKQLFCVTLLSNPRSCMSLRPKRTKHWGLEWRKVYCRGHARRMQWLMLKRPKLPNGCQGSIFKGKMREGGGHRVCDQLVYKSFIGWWWGKRAMSQGLALSILRLQWVWGICAQGHLVVNVFHLVVVVVGLASVKQLKKCTSGFVILHTSGRN